MAKARKGSSSRLRIIGGEWRSRQLPFVEVPGLRPTPDRVRETLFNWLQADIAGSHCLDLFAGTGALGFESLSRFAASVTFVEPDSRAFSHIQATLGQLEHSAPVIKGTAEAFLGRNEQAFDIVFVDPPFDAACQLEIMSALRPQHVADGALVYMEAPSRQAFDDEWPPGFQLHREKQFGDVSARLFRVSQDS